VEFTSKRRSAVRIVALGMLGHTLIGRTAGVAQVRRVRS
jgi:hypothetical protein